MPNAVSANKFSIFKGAVKIVGVLTIDGPDGTRTIIDASDLDSAAKEKITGQFDGGKVSLTLNYHPGAASQVALYTDFLSGNEGAYSIKNNAATPVQICAFTAIVTNYGQSIGVDKTVGLKADLEITGPVVFGAGV